MSSDLSGRPLGAWYGGIYVGEVDGGVYILIIIRRNFLADFRRFVAHTIMCTTFIMRVCE